MRNKYIITIASIIALHAGMAAAQSPKNTVEYHLAAQPMNLALNALAERAGIQIIYNTDAVENIQTSPLDGRYTIEDALQRVLANHGLVYKFQDDKTVVIRKASSTDSGKEGLLQDGQGDAKGRMRRSGLEEIVVTAQKREQSLKDVPISVSAVTSEGLKARGIDGITQLADTVPGLAFTNSTQGGGNASFYIRGIGQSDFISTNDPGVGIYVDGVYIARTAGGSLDLLDIERVEVLRGPQGTLFGKNTIGGAISVITKKPTFEFGGRVRAKIGSRNRLNLGFSVNAPIVDNVFAVRVSGESIKQDGFGHSLFDGKLSGGEDNSVGRILALFLPSDDLEITLSADVTRMRGENAQSTMVAVNPNTFVTIPQNQWAVANGIEPFDERWISPDPDHNYAAYHPGNNTDIWGVSMNVVWTHDNWNIKSITAYRDLKTDTGIDYDATPFAFDQGVKVTQNQFSQEVLASGNSFGGVLDWVGGLYYLKENGFSDINLRLSYAANPDGYDTDTTNDFSNESYAAYGQANINITDQLGLVFGGRYSYEKKENAIQTYAIKYGIDFLPLTKAEKSWKSFTYRVGAQYKFDDSMVYASIASGFKSGGFNGRAQSASFLSFDPEKAITKEVGVKGELFDHHFDYSAAVFETKYKDIQTTLNVVDPVTQVTTNIVGNPADARLRGFELEGSMAPIDYVTLNYGVTYLDAKYTKLAPGADVTLQSKLAETPKWTLNFGAQLDLPASTGLADNGVFSARVDYTYKDGFYYGAQNSSFNYEKARSLVNARIAYGPDDGAWNIAGYARNLFNKRYNNYREDLLAFIYAINMPAAPRELGLELNFTW